MIERVYQVKMKINEATFSELMSWLSPHMEDMLQLPYFFKKELLMQKDLGGDFIFLFARYFYKNSEDIQTYFKFDVDKMRTSLPDSLRAKIHFERFLVEENKL